jgi:predicted CXXCH cytochrome family protein
MKVTDSIRSGGLRESSRRGGAFALACRRSQRFLLAFLLCAALAHAGAAEVNQRLLPPSAQVKVDFARDIKPMFEARCNSCHGPERSKSKFRLDNRESALRGGENGIAILPGQSSKSPIIYYVAGIIRDLEMPPPGKGDPLTAEEIGLLRAWIDQGAAWESVTETNRAPVLQGRK